LFTRFVEFSFRSYWYVLKSLFKIYFLFVSLILAYGGGYGAGSIPQMSNILTAMRDQNIQRPLLPQGYGQQQSETASG
jgi:hypothetical protein